MDEEIFLFKDKEEFIKNHLESLKKFLSKNLDKLPNRELPFMEPHLRALYFQAYYLIAEGFYNASLALCGILLENLVKEKLFMSGVSDEEIENSMGFGKAINKAREMNLFTDEELKFLEIKKESLRNPYAHYNKMKLSEGSQFYVFKIPNGVERIKSVLEKTMKGKMTDSQGRQELIKGIEPEIMTSKDFRPLAQTAKGNFEERFALNIFLEIDKFTREFAKKYFKPKEKNIE